MTRSIGKRKEAKKIVVMYGKVDGAICMTLRIFKYVGVRFLYNIDSDLQI